MEQIQPMFELMYEKFLGDLQNHNDESMVYQHHVRYILDNTRFYAKEMYNQMQPDDIVADYIASMTDDYFIDLFEYLFPNSKYGVKYIGYFHNSEV